ncbi:hypothetical protein OHB41_08360 [Streptomyces sp. NBC_01571]|uniref:hypothetical protein n=1 Tax=Streptomyces sp. NBC_01571 TaxID=2975883 RepID=UPI00224F11CB|nr:hypothetical protein [Streptomyces sp. NBC_01571]MCX4573191.1 hypothetical protein [Streptomyces sp. NBC_01571]
MPSPSRPHGRLQPAAARINTAIRRLMEEPNTPRRAVEYQRLLVEWEKATRADMVKAA